MRARGGARCGGALLACACGIAWLAGAACAPARGGWDWRALERAYPELAEVRGERLRDAHPYLRPVLEPGSEALELFLCRWPTGRTLGVALPPDAGPDHRALLDRALRAWNQAGLGVRLRPSGPPADVEIRFVPEGDGGAWPKTAFAAADCRADTRGPLVRARVWLDRANLDLLGRPRPLTPEEFLGAALHELGHALGFQGHGVLGPSVVVREVGRVRRTGERVLEGRALSDPSLQALYAVPSGVGVGRLPLSGELATLLRVLGREAERRGFRGPLVRVGDRSARLFWTDADDHEVGVVVPRWSQVVADPEALRLIPDRAARRWLADAADTAID
ncbi:MAG: hypothetical protein ACQGVK_06945 [Myxococcota bacterium]